LPARHSKDQASARSSRPYFAVSGSIWTTSSVWIYFTIRPSLRPSTNGDYILTYPPAPRPHYQAGKYSDHIHAHLGRQPICSNRYHRAGVPARQFESLHGRTPSRTSSTGISVRRGTTCSSSSPMTSQLAQSQPCPHWS
jgi:hypothetical protein